MIQDGSEFRVCDGNPFRDFMDEVGFLKKGIKLGHHTKVNRMPTLTQIIRKKI